MSKKINTKFIRNPYVYWTFIGLFYYAAFSYWDRREGLFFALHFVLLQALIVHVNTKYLLPKFQYNTMKYQLNSFLLLAVFVVASIYIEHLAFEFLLDHKPDEHKGPPPMFWIIFMNTLVLGMPLFMSTAFYILEQEREHRKQIENLEKLQGETELKFLKSQINPHFLFNALNNIYTISYIGDQSAPGKILMLSDMLRYVLYDCKSDQVPLSRELDYLNSYIEFQQLKTEQAQNIQLDIDKIDEGIQIAPMVLIPFIENSFKHSKIDTDKEAWVKIQLKTEKNQLLFYIRNSMPDIPPQNWLNSEGGIGLENVKKRLNLLYRDKHILNISTNLKEYSVDLTIDID